MCPNGCGCGRHRGNNATHGAARGYRQTPEWTAWSHLKTARLCGVPVLAQKLRAISLRHGPQARPGSPACPRRQGRRGRMSVGHARATVPNGTVKRVGKERPCPRTSLRRRESSVASPLCYCGAAGRFDGRDLRVNFHQNGVLFRFVVTEGSPIKAFPKLPIFGIARLKDVLVAQH
jgi:hypothetical protein